MADDFNPSAPVARLYKADEQGNIDFKDRDTNSGLWVSWKDNGPYLKGRIGQTRYLINFNKFEPGLVKEFAEKFSRWAASLSDGSEPDW